MDIKDVFGSMPQRPNTKDFWRLSEIVLEMDGAMQAAQTDDDKEAVWQRYMGEHCDHNSLYYVALQRSMHILGVQTAADAMAQFGLLAKLTTVYSEGFVVGCTFKDRGGHQDD